MISSILARIFTWLTAFSMIATIITVVCEIRQQPIRIHRNGGDIIYGNPGMTINVRKLNSDEVKAPDTTINYSFVTSDSSKGQGTVKLSGETYQLGTEIFNKHLAKRNAGQEKMEIDSTFILLREFHPKEIPVRNNGINKPLPKWALGTEKDADTMTTNGVVIADGYAFASWWHLNQYQLENDYRSTNRIEQQWDAHEKMKILPANNLQAAGFVGYDIIVYGCLTLLFFCLSRLLKNFSRRDYFSLKNIRLLMFTGWLILIPQAAAFINYWIFLGKISLAKVQLKSNDFSKQLASYDISIDTEWTLIFLGLGLLVLSYIFKDGLTIKEENESFT